MRRRNPSVAELQREADRLNNLLTRNQEEILDIRQRQNDFIAKYPKVQEYLKRPSARLWKQIRRIDVSPDYSMPVSLDLAVEQKDIVIRGKADINLADNWEYFQDDDVMLSAYVYTGDDEYYAHPDVVQDALNFWLGVERNHSLMLDTLDLLDQLEEIEDDLILQRRKEFQVILGGRKNPLMSRRMAYRRRR